MQIHQVTRKTKNKTSQSVGRGGKRGKTSGRGTKGQKARAGAKFRPEMRDFIKRLPKLRGRGKNIFQSIQTKPVVVNLSAIEKAFSEDDVVNPTTLVAKGLIKMLKGNYPVVKLLSSGELTKKVTVSNCLLSAKTKEKIEKAGGMVK